MPSSAHGSTHTIQRNRARLLVDGHRILPVLLRDIAKARKTVHVSVFLFFRDPIGEEIAAALEERARAGVQVRVLLNVQKTGMGDPFSTGEKEMMKSDPSFEQDPLDVGPLCERMKRAGVAVVDTNIDYDAVPKTADARLRSVAAQIRDAIAVDDLHVDHRKIVIIDGSVAYSGGVNIGAQYLFHEPFDPERSSKEEAAERKAAGLPEPWWKWHDSLTRFEGPIAHAIDEQFRVRWILDGGDDFELSPPAERPASGDAIDASETSPDAGLAVENATILLNAPDGSPNAVRELYVDLIRRATRSIFIENPYLYHPSIVEALCAAKQKTPSLEVVLVLPCRDHNDNAFAQDAQEHCYERYVACGIEVREYLHHFNHLKLAVFDERWSIHGSTNLNYRSLEDDKDFELVVLVDDVPFAQRVLAEVRDVDRTRSRRIEQKDVEGLSLEALRVRMRDPRTLLLISRRVL
jgi:cardiolipin synthase